MLLFRFLSCWIVETSLEGGPVPGQENFTYYGKAYEATRARIGYAARAPTPADVEYEHAVAPDLDARTLGAVKHIYKSLRSLTPRRSHDADANAVQESVNAAIEKLMMIPVPPPLLSRVPYVIVFVRIMSCHCHLVCSAGRGVGGGEELVRGG